MANAFLIGPSVYLRPLEREDAPLVAGYLNNPAVRRTLAAYRPLSVGQEQAFLEALATNEQNVVLGVVSRDRDLLIGVTGLHRLDFRGRHAEFGLFIGDPSYWGRGLGTEATRLMLDYGFGTLNLNRVWLQVFGHHASAQRVYEKAGFRREGIQREQHFVEGRYTDGVLMGILRAEWTPLLPELREALKTPASREN
ncbi:GNAT family N-acetyltransferase [Pyxidicoccus fallax]|uniref:GNAT family N-acetyltransferase n=1 Tax=Pyxidicoccus fallax TaxID=394095 RepID=A0A848LRG8_9BACT|nr:GNAT family protein [Pyxidicoccus fallax]NMO20269.1 GNAT family N-acetyltransferase [Pyxidicoccus fallax]NPC84533.1 GNAT family N-acetyltransferase [Pyxidicoccus fallax]